MRFLFNMKFYVLSLDEFIQILFGYKEEPKRSVMITFDDGYRDTYEIAFQILKKFSLPATVFLVTGDVGGRNFWDEGGVELMNERMTLEMSKAGISFGAHTKHHFLLPNEKIDLVKKEILESKKEMEKILGSEVISFAYPYGAVMPWVKEIVKEAGFQCAFATDSGPLKFREDPFEIRRIGMFPGTGLVGFLRKTSGLYHHYRQFLKTR